MNSEDYEIIREFIEKDEFLSSLNIKENKDLLRGNIGSMQMELKLMILFHIIH